MPGARLSLSEAAERLGVSTKRVYAMLRAGQLPGERRGSQWTVPASAVYSLNNNIWRAPGRPLAQSTAWKLMHSDLRCKPHRSQAELDALRRRLRARSQHLEVSVPSGLLDRVRHDRRVVVGGRDAALEIGTPIDLLEVIDVYVRAGDLEGFLHDHAAAEVIEDSNVHVHVVDDAHWPFEHDQRMTDEWTAWLDLADARDRAADTLLDRLVGGRLHA
jgi:excisionase family DNA binding protein